MGDENLMQAHRSHLYQYMSNELGMPHWQVSLLYAITRNSLLEHWQSGHIRAPLHCRLFGWLCMA